MKFWLLLMELSCFLFTPSRNYSSFQGWQLTFLSASPPYRWAVHLHHCGPSSMPDQTDLGSFIIFQYWETVQTSAFVQALPPQHKPRMRFSRVHLAVFSPHFVHLWPYWLLPRFTTRAVHRESPSGQKSGCISNQFALSKCRSHSKCYHDWCSLNMRLHQLTIFQPTS